MVPQHLIYVGYNSSLAQNCLYSDSLKTQVSPLPSLTSILAFRDPGQQQNILTTPVQDTTHTSYLPHDTE
jgi:hypothetical protein